MIATSTAPSAQRPTVHTVLGLPFPRTSCSGALAGAGGRGFVFTAARSSQRCSRIFTCAALTGAEEAACLAITSRASGYHLGPLPDLSLPDPAKISSMGILFCIFYEFPLSWRQEGFGSKKSKIKMWSGHTSSECAG
jgi:hypothetical protein